MELEARGLIIDKSVDAAEELNKSLLPEIRLTDFEVRRTLLKGIQSFRETQFDVCFISDSFTIAELGPFFADLKALQRVANCVFVQVRDSLGEGSTRDSMVNIGFATIITRKASDGDKAAVGVVLTELLKAQEIQRRKVDVASAIKLLMLEINRVAKDRKRGIHREYSRDIVSGYVTDQLDLHPDVLETYFEALEQHSDKGTAYKDLVVELPEHLLDLDLPGIKDGVYNGTSLRVWEMLREKYGREEGAEPKVSAGAHPTTSDDRDGGHESEASVIESDDAKG